MTLTQEFIHQSILRMNQNTPKIMKCVELLNEEELWKRPNANLNSVGNLVLHLCGNITQYIISSIGKLEDLRDRDAEFTQSSTFNRHDLMIKLSNTVAQAIEIFRNLTEEELLEEKSVQGFTSTALGNIVQVVEHYSYHTGQIIWWTKLLKDRDMGFYAHLDLNQKNII